MFLFAIGYGVGPQFVRGIASDGLPQALFAVVVCVFCLIAPYLGAKMAGYDSAPPRASTPARRRSRRRWALRPTRSTVSVCRRTRPRRSLDAMPVAYAVTYIFGTVGSAIVIALLGPALLGIDLEAACKRYEEKHGGKKEARRSGHGLAPIRVARIPRQGRRHGLSERPRRRPKRCCPSNGSSSNAFAAAARSSMRRPIP